MSVTLLKAFTISDNLKRLKKNVIVKFAFVLLSVTLFSCGGNNTLEPKQELLVGETLVSKDGNFKLTLQGDGNMVVGDKNGAPIWASNTAGQPITKCLMQEDGNVVLYDNEMKPYWASNTARFGGAKLSLDDEGFLTIYYKNKPVWVNGDMLQLPGYGYLSTGKELGPNQPIFSNNLQYKLTLMDDGNITVSDEKNTVTWSSNTTGKPATKCLFQGDGNFVLYDNANNALWASNTYQYPGSRLVLDDDGFLSIYYKGRPVWVNGETIQVPIPGLKKDSVK